MRWNFPTTPRSPLSFLKGHKGNGLLPSQVRNFTGLCRIRAKFFFFLWIWSCIGSKMMGSCSLSWDKTLWKVSDKSGSFYQIVTDYRWTRVVAVAANDDRRQYSLKPLTVFLWLTFGKNTCKIQNLLFHIFSCLAPSFNHLFHEQVLQEIYQCLFKQYLLVTV